LKLTVYNILILLIITSLIISCDAVKRVPEESYLLSKNTIYVNDKKEKSENINNLLYQSPNSKILNVPLRLHIYNLARPNIDSIVNTTIDKRPKKRENLDWETMNKLSEKNPDFMKFLQDIKIDFESKRIHKDEYDDIIDPYKHIEEKIANKT